MRIRQLALVAQDLEPTLEQLRAVFDLNDGFADPGVATFGLVNRVLVLGDTFLEVVSPEQDGTTAGRLLEKRGGDGGYMVIVQSDGEDLGLASERERMQRLGVRTVFELELEDIATLHLHPRDVGGAILSIDRAIPPASWHWAGPNWEAQKSEDRIGRIVGAGIQSQDPAAMAHRWAAVLDRETSTGEGGHFQVALDDSTLRFLPDEDGRGDGLAEIDIACSDPGAVLRTAGERGLAHDPHASTLGVAGVCVRLRATV